MSHNSGASSGNLVLISKQTASTSASINFTSVTGFDVYYLDYYGVINATNNDPLELRVSTNGGVSYSNAGYIAFGYFCYQAGGLVQNPAGAAQTGFFLANAPDNAAATPTCGNAYIYNLANTAFNKYCMTTNVQYYGGFPVMEQISNVWPTTTAVNALQIITTSGGNINSGTFKLYGVAN